MITYVPHHRKRHVKDLYKKCISFSPIVGVFGHRQVGKSTFISENVSEYATLDDEDLLNEARKAPKTFIENRKYPFGIDECQLEPRLFPALKERVRTEKKPGQFVLSGSVRFTSRKAIQESLAGRMAFFEMLPFSISELRSEPLPSIVPSLLEHKIFSKDSFSILRPKSDLHSVKKDFDTYLKNGGLPGLCFIREDEHRRGSLRFLHDLILDRDIRLIWATQLPAQTLRRFLEWLAINAFQKYSFSDVKKALRISPETQKKLLYAMESVFLIRRIPIVGQKGEIILLEDQLEEFVLSKGTLNWARQCESALFRNIRCQFTYRLGSSAEFATYRTRDGARVPLVVQAAEGMLGMIVCQESRPSLSEKRSAMSFLARFPNSKILFLTTQVIEPEVLNEKTLLTSVYSVV
jgi:predicted AAA+ superfamily ATPase